MHRPSPASRSDRAFAPRLEPLESRDLPTNILFFGNSYTNFAPTSRVDQLVAEIATVAGRPAPYINGRIVGGATLADHVNAVNPALIQSLLPAGEQWDFVVIQGQSVEPTATLGNPGAFRQNALQLFEIVQSTSPGVKAVLYETWARGPLHSFYNSVYTSPAQMQAELRDGYTAALSDIRTANEFCSAEVAQAGDAWEIYGFNNLYAPDQEHPNNRGGLLAALTIYTQIYQDDVADIPSFSALGLLAPRGLTETDWAQLTFVSDQATRVVDLTQFRQYVANAYLDTLGRTADEGGLSYWTSQLSRHAFDRQTFSSLLAASPESQQRQVREAYQTLLGRDADPFGLGAWQQFLSSGGSASVLRVALMSSDEYFVRAGGTNNTFLNRLYLDALGRALDAGGAAFWNGLLQSGLGRDQVAAFVGFSSEACQFRVQTLYLRFLGRTADAASLLAWCNFLQAGGTESAIPAVLVAADEYYCA